MILPDRFRIPRRGWVGSTSGFFNGGIAVPGGDAFINAKWSYISLACAKHRGA